MRFDKFGAHERNMARVYKPDLTEKQIDEMPQKDFEFVVRSGQKLQAERQAAGHTRYHKKESPPTLAKSKRKSHSTRPTRTPEANPTPQPRERVRVWVASGSTAMSSTNTNLSRFADPAIFAGIGFRTFVTEGGLIYMRQVRPPPIDIPRKIGALPIQGHLFAGRQGAEKIDDLAFDRDAVTQALEMYLGRSENPSKTILGMASGIVRVCALSHAMDDWMWWDSELAGAFHFGEDPHHPDREAERGRRAMRIYHIARAMLLRNARGKAYALIGAFEHPRDELGEGWYLGPPAFVYQGRFEQSQPRFSGAIARMPTSMSDETGIIYHAGESLLHAGQCRAPGVTMPELIARKEGVDVDVLHLYRAMGLEIPADKSEAKKRLQWFSRRIDKIVESQPALARRETIEFSWLPRSRHRDGRRVNIRATGDYRSLYAPGVKSELAIGLESILSA